jgi:hypothetical protein
MGVEPLAAFALGRHYIYRRHRFRRFAAGFHYVIWGGERPNYVYLRKFKNRETKSNILETTAGHGAWPAPNPPIDTQIVKERPFSQEEWANLDKAVKNKDVKEINRIFKETA